MCCFSVAAPAGFFQRLFAPKVHVSATNIFARMIAPGVQALAYGMNLDVSREVAMILPIPVRPKSGEDAVRFVDLHQHPRMFTELADLFASPELALPKGGPYRFAGAQSTLEVHRVGSFIASYVPTRFDFDRLDRRFWLPRVLFDAVPHYSDYGFAVFQLAAGKTTVHPMAFTFPTREIETLFLPTVHVHDGRFHKDAKFDHALYYQAARDADGSDDGDETSGAMPKRDYAGLVDVSRPIVRRTLTGKLPNEDTWIAVDRPLTVRPYPDANPS